MIKVDKKDINIFCLFVFLLIITPILSACGNKNITIDNWEEQVLYAKECGMDGLPCCSDKEKKCLYGQECCIDPNNSERNMCADECDCGKEGAFCCSGDNQCGDGLACFAGYCVECGGISDPCCAGDIKCNNDLICNNDLCVSCGIPGNPCCTTGISCINQEKRNNSRTECRNDLCIYCGSDSQIACQYEPACALGHLLNNDYCLKCGGPNQPCCNDVSGVDYICENSDLVCELGFCTKK
jgi:hypothetical protein